MEIRAAKAPCATCPWRVATVTRDIPGGGMDGEGCRRARAGGLFSTVMLCHRTEVNEVCAGFLLSEDADHHLGLRFAYAVGALKRGETVRGGVDLYPTFEAMMRAHGVLDPVGLDSGEVFDGG